jgi:hypothetical protein
MKIHASLASSLAVSFVAFAFGLVIGTPVADAQVLVAQPYQAFIVQPSGTLATATPLFAASTGRPLQIVTVETVRTIRPAARPAVRHHIVTSRKIQDRVAQIYDRPLYNTVAAPIAPTAVTTPMVQVQAAAATPVVAVGQSLSGQFQCIQGCAPGAAGPAFVTQNGWDLNLVNEIGQPSRAWIDYPGHIWVQNWNEGAVYSPDQMTIQFDNGTVWSKNVILLVPR